jgi:nucleoside-diphosphate-sugar epimerase
MSRHLIVGAGPVGSAVAAQLLQRGDEVRVVTRSGSGPADAERVAADAGDKQRLAELAKGVDTIFNCANPPYTEWTTQWPPMAEAMLHAAAESGAVLAITGNLYPYGPVTAPMTESQPDRPSSVKGGVRAQMWADALKAADSGRIRAAVEVRGSDYVGVGPSILTLLVLPRARAGKRATVPANLDVVHTWTNPNDMARLLVSASSDPRGHNRIWHTPSAPAVTVRELSRRACELAGIPAPKLSSMPLVVLRAAGLVNGQARAFAEMNYQFRRPFVLDTAATEAVFGSECTPLEESIRQNLEWAQQQ